MDLSFDTHTARTSSEVPLFASAGALRPAPDDLRVLDSLWMPVIVLNGERLVRYRNPAARELMRRTRHLRVTAGRLGCPSPSDQRALVRALEDVLSSASGGASDPGWRRSICLRPDVECQPLVAAISRSDTRAAGGAAAGEPAAVIVVHLTSDRTEVDPEILRHAFGLTPSESRVAVMLARGDALRDVASRRGVSLETVRSQLRAVFEKTGTRRQADLIRLLAELSAHSAPPIGVQDEARSAPGS